MNIKQKVIFNTFAQLLGKAATTVTTLLITILVTRRFGPAGYGDLTLMLAYSALFYIVADFGINAIAVRELSADEKKTSYYFGNLMSLRFLMATILFAIGAVALLFFPYSFYVKCGILISLLTIFTQALYTSANAVFQTKLRYDLSVLAAILGSLTILLGSVAVLRAHGGILPIILSYVIGGVVMVSSSLFLVWWLIKGFRLHFDLSLWKRLFLTALPLGLTTIFCVVLAKADTMILSVLKGNVAVGLYGAAYKVFEVALVFPTFFVNAIYPVFVRHFKEGKGKLIKTAKTSGLFLLGVSIVGSVLGISLSALMIRIIGGVEFGESVVALKLLLLGLPIFYLSALFLWLMITLGKQRIIPMIYGIGALFNIAANIIFIPRFSFYASAVITWLSELLILALLVYFSYRALK